MDTVKKGEVAGFNPDLSCFVAEGGFSQSILSVNFICEPQFQKEKFNLY